MVGHTETLLEAPAEGFFWNFPEFGRRIRLDVLYGCEMRPLEAHIPSKAKPLGASSGGWVMTGMFSWRGITAQ
jgi:hypothetical protein